MKPYLGAAVLVNVAANFNNGSDVAPAVITHVWSDDLVNLRVVYDGPSTMPPDAFRVDWMTSVAFHGSLDPAAANSRGVYGAFWPPETRQ